MDCLKCKYFIETGTEDSGIPSKHNPEINWYYIIGDCNSIPILGTSAGSKGIAHWRGDVMCFKKKGK